MKKSTLAILTAASVAVTGVPVAVVASSDPPPPPIGVELLTPRSEFTDDVRIGIKVRLDDHPTRHLNMRHPSRTVVARITVQPGAHFPWHTHPGPVLVNVSEGELTYVQASDCVEREYPAGTAFVDPGRGNVHTASNPSDEVRVLLATFFEVPAEGPLTITEGVVPPDDCNVEMGSHAHP